MTIRLNEHGTSFATRERARELMRLFAGQDVSGIDFDGVLCSPSFLAELLLGFTGDSNIRALATDAATQERLRRMTSQLGLCGKVRVEPVVSA